MRNRGMLLSLIALLLPVSVLAATPSSKPFDAAYDYVGFGGGMMEIREHGVIIGDYGTRATFCGSGSPYFCVNSYAFNFAVPKHITRDKKSWIVDGHKYKLVSPVRWMVIMGRSISVVIISNTSHMPNGDSGSTFYYYSPKIGLIGFENRVKIKCGNPVNSITKSFNKYPDLYIVAGKTGFGAE